MPKFSIAAHTPGPKSIVPAHFDLFLQMDDSLLSWRMPEMASAQTNTIVCERTKPHRLSYLHYEGELSEGRGSVKILMQGEVDYRLVSDNELIAFLSNSQIRFQIFLHALENPPNWSAYFSDWTPFSPST